jgi:hypothetical protein
MSTLAHQAMAAPALAARARGFSAGGGGVGGRVGVGCGTTATDGGRLTRREGAGQGLSLVQFSGQLERFLWDRGCA